MDRIEAARPECTRELVADVVLKRREARRQQLGATGLVLLNLGEARLTRSAQHADHGRLIGRARTTISADVDLLV